MYNHFIAHSFSRIWGGSPKWYCWKIGIIMLIMEVVSFCHLRTYLMRVCVFFLMLKMDLKGYCKPFQTILGRKEKPKELDRSLNQISTSMKKTQFYLILGKKTKVWKLLGLYAQPLVGGSSWIFIVVASRNIYRGNNTTILQAQIIWNIDVSITINFTFKLIIFL